MKFKLSSSLLLVTLIAGFVTAQAQIPCGPTISPLPTRFVNWPQYHFDPNHSGCSPYESLLSINTVRNLVLKLKFVTSGEIFASPVVANGIAYTASGSGDLYAVSVNTGEFLWGLWAFASIQASPVVSNGVVYVGSFDGYPDNLFALNARTGDVLWQYETTTGQIQGDGALAVSNGVLYVGTNLGLEALDATTGALLWKETSLGGARPTVSNGMVYIAAGIRQGIVYALDAGTGKVIWSSSTGYYPFACTPVVVNNMVYVGTSENHVVAMDAKTGATLWTSTLGGSPGAAPAVADGVLYVTSRVLSDYPVGYLTALNASTGEIIWNNSAYAPSSPVVVNGVVYYGSGNYYVLALNANTGTLLWESGTNDIIQSSPVVANGVLYVTSTDYNLYAFSLPGH